MLLRFFILLNLLFSVYTHAYTPTDSLLVKLPSIEVNSSRSRLYTTGISGKQIDSIALKNNATHDLGALINEQSGVFIKNYGPGSLAMSSIRGAGAAHTAVLWNGLPLQSPMHGLIDFTLVPVLFFDAITIQPGGGAAINGSGAIGGAIQLENTPVFSKTLELLIGTQTASFDNKQQLVGVKLANSHIYSSTKLFYQTASNNYEFKNLAKVNSPIEYLPNAQLENYGLLHDLDVRLTNNQTLSFHLWYQHTNRQIPPTMISLNSKAVQIDETFRASGGWKYIRDHYTIIARTAFFTEKLFYKAPLYQIDSPSRAWSSINEVEANLHFTSKQEAHLGLSALFSKAITTNYSAPTTDTTLLGSQQRLSTYACYKLRAIPNKLEIGINVREELFAIRNEKTTTDYSRLQLAPLVGSIGIDYMPLKALTIKTNLSRNYRIPTLNDLFWTPGGNLNLKPEDGLSEELGIAFTKQISILKLFLKTTVFNNNTNQWIMWVPDNTNIWSPHNIQRVWGRGVETNLKLEYSLFLFRFNLQLDHQFVESTNESLLQNIFTGASSLSSVSDQGKQLIYVPKNKMVAQLGVSYKNSSIQYISIFTGTRYITSDNTQFLNPFWLSSLRFSQHILISNMNTYLTFKINNLFDVPYQTIAWMPMPGINYEFSFTINFKTKSNEKP